MGRVTSGDRTGKNRHARRSQGVRVTFPFSVLRNVEGTHSPGGLKKKEAAEEMMGEPCLDCTRIVDHPGNSRKYLPVGSALGGSKRSSSLAAGKRGLCQVAGVYYVRNEEK